MRKIIGKAIRFLRECRGLTQGQAAAALGITNVHLCLVEKGNRTPSWGLLAEIQRVWGVDVYVLAWCKYGDHRGLPPGVQAAAKRLSRLWSEQLERQGIAV